MSRNIFNDKGMMIKLDAEVIDLNVMFLGETTFKNIRLSEDDTITLIKQAIFNQEVCYIGNMLINFRNVKQAYFKVDGSIIRI